MKRGAALAHRDLAQGLQSAAYKAIFKSTEYEIEISQTFGFIEQLPSLQDPKPLDYVCIRTKQDADRYTRSAALSEEIWNKCQQSTTFSVSAIFYNRLFLCERFFDLPIDSEEPLKQTCPWVWLNKFIDNGNGQRFRQTQNGRLLRFHLLAYRRHLTLPPTTHYLEALNHAVGTTSDDSPDGALNYDIYTLLVTNQCDDIPDPFQPPWNFPPDLTLETNSRLNMTSRTNNSALALSLASNQSTGYLQLPQADEDGPGGGNIWIGDETL